MFHMPAYIKYLDFRWWVGARAVARCKTSTMIMGTFLNDLHNSWNKAINVTHLRKYFGNKKFLGSLSDIVFYCSRFPCLPDIINGTISIVLSLTRLSGWKYIWSSRNINKTSTYELFLVHNCHIKFTFMVII